MRKKEGQKNMLHENIYLHSIDIHIYCAMMLVNLYLFTCEKMLQDSEAWNIDMNWEKLDYVFPIALMQVHLVDNFPAEQQIGWQMCIHHNQSAIYCHN